MTDPIPTPVQTIAAQSSWPEAAIAIAGVALVGVVVVVVVWQALVTWRVRIATTGEQPYRKLATGLVGELQDINKRLDRLERANDGERA